MDRQDGMVAIDELTVKGKAARKAARRLATISADVKNAALHNVADGLKRGKKRFSRRTKRTSPTAESADSRNTSSTVCC